ncbi:lytic murein transglycosylase [Aliisedimentitalea scapharcae]
MRRHVTGAVLALLSGSVGWAELPTSVVRPTARPDKFGDTYVHVIVGQKRPQARPVAQTTISEPKIMDRTQTFAEWSNRFREKAVANGISPETVDRAFRGIVYDAEVVRRDRNQSEFTKTIWDYLDTAVSDARVNNGKTALAQYRHLLQRIEETYGVDKQVLLAIWGLESAYGAFRGNDKTVQSLATLAYDPRRSSFFEEQLMEALSILQSGDVSADRMRGSWAGAMGHTQFMPTSFRDHAVDFTGDGKRDIWSDDPSDALASTAAYLAHHGWTTGQPWGVEVALPKDFDYRLANRSIKKQPAAWGQMGILDTHGKPVKNHGLGSILLPAGGTGAAFMIFDNFEVIESYNTADAYVIGVGHLGDRIMGGNPVQAKWPRADRALTYKERTEMQQRLTLLGFDTQGIDGKIGPRTIDAVRAYQVANGLLPDGYPSLRLLDLLR